MQVAAALPNPSSLLPSRVPVTPQQRTRPPHHRVPTFLPPSLPHACRYKLLNDWDYTSRVSVRRITMYQSLLQQRAWVWGGGGPHAVTQQAIRRWRRRRGRRQGVPHGHARPMRIATGS